MVSDWFLGVTIKKKGEKVQRLIAEQQEECKTTIFINLWMLIVVRAKEDD